MGLGYYGTLIVPIACPLCNKVSTDAQMLTDGKWCYVVCRHCDNKFRYVAEVEKRVKQRITVEQLQQLTPEQQENLREMWVPQEYDVFTYKGTEQVIDMDYWDVSEVKIKKNLFLPLLTIGQMIELIIQEGSTEIKFCTLISPTWQLWTSDAKQRVAEEEDLVDILWEAVKEVF